MSNCRANSASVLLPLTAARATFALKAGEWFRRGRLVIVSWSPAILAAIRQKLHLSRCSDFQSQLHLVWHRAEYLSQICHPPLPKGFGATLPAVR
jgi:hypothetical protein